ncbi:SMC-Scp complex subunit ScpB [Geminicoccaceae bacterium 1502E]|nr:SMC-Scp complex subunit ScpB [Geminicoccaceae bacterium 1502E]
MSEIAPKHIVEALLFAAGEPLEERVIQAHLGEGAMAREVLLELQRDYAGRGVRIERQERAWAVRTAPEVAPHLKRVLRPTRRLSRPALETLAIIAYQQPVTRAEIEAVRGVTVAQGTLDLLIETGWVAPHGRRDAPGRPITWITTPAFLDEFGLSSLGDLPRLEELEAAGLFNGAGER